jgi:PIN domain nuclease of toxin-antitoxin system
MDRTRPADAPADAAPLQVHAMILLDTNAVLFLLAGHRRARPLRQYTGRLRFTPVALLELQFLQEVGRGIFTTDEPANAVADDPRWIVDDPPLSAVIRHAMDLTWTRDPFDRLIAAHAVFRGWRLATSDGLMLDNLPSHLALSL